MPSQQSKYLEDWYRGLAERMAAQPDMDLPILRDMFEAWHTVTGEPTGVSYEQVDADGVPAIWCNPDGCAPDRVLLFLHGGGFVVGSMHSHRKLAGHLAKAAGTRALVVDYRRAPEHPFPAQIQDAVTAYRWLLGQGIRPEHIASTGDSAGGNLCTSLVLALGKEGDPLPAAIMPMSPWYDMELTGESLDTRADVDALVQRPILEGMRAMFLGDASPDDPLANPLHADLAGLPPMLIHTGDHDTLLDDTTRFAARARDAGVDVTVEISPEMQHVYPFLAGRAAEGDETVARMGKWVRSRLGLG